MIDKKTNNGVNVNDAKLNTSTPESQIRRKKSKKRVIVASSLGLLGVGIAGLTTFTTIRAVNASRENAELRDKLSNDENNITQQEKNNNAELAILNSDVQNQLKLIKGSETEIMRLTQFVNQGLDKIKTRNDKVNNLEEQISNLLNQNTNAEKELENALKADNKNFILINELTNAIKNQKITIAQLINEVKVERKALEEIRTEFNNSNKNLLKEINTFATYQKNINDLSTKVIKLSEKSLLDLKLSQDFRTEFMRLNKLLDNATETIKNRDNLIATLEQKIMELSKNNTNNTNVLTTNEQPK